MSATTFQEVNEPGSMSTLRVWLEVASIPVLAVAGAILGGLTGFPPMSSIIALLLPVIAATFYLRRSGDSWRGLIVGEQLSGVQVAGYVTLAIFGALITAYLVTTVLQQVFGLPAIDVSRFVTLVENNPVMYLWYLIPVAWGSAAIGEELICRGFLMQRLKMKTGTWVAVVLQAFIFSLAHFYQGITGVLAIFTFALVFGAVYVRNGGNLIPLIIAHGLIDTWAMTVVFLGRPDLLIGT